MVKKGVYVDAYDGERLALLSYDPKKDEVLLLSLSSHNRVFYDYPSLGYLENSLVLLGPKELIQW